MSGFYYQEPNRQTVQYCESQAPSVAQEVCDFCQGAMGFVQIAAGVLGVVHAGAQLFVARQAQPQAQQPVYLAAPSAPPAQPVYAQVVEPAIPPAPPPPPPVAPVAPAAPPAPPVAPAAPQPVAVTANGQPLF